MTVVTREYNAYDIADVERSVSKIVGRDVSIGEIEIEIKDDLLSVDFNIVAYVDGTAVLGFDEEGNLICDPFEERNFGEIFLDEKYIFNFDVNLFAGFERHR